MNNKTPLEKKETPSFKFKLKALASIHPLVFILSVSFLLRVYRLPQQSIWFDEWLHYVVLADQDFSTYLQTFKIAIPEHANSPVFYVLIYFWAQIVGLTPWALRLLPVILGVMSVALMYLLAARLYSKRAGIISSLFLAVSPVHIWFSQEIRPYGLMFFLGLCSLLILELALTSSQRKRICWSFYYFITTLFIFNHLFSLLILVPQGIYILFRRGMRTFIVWTLPYGLIIGVLILFALNTSHTTIGVQITVPGPSILKTVVESPAKDILSMHKDMMPVWENSPHELLSSFLNMLLSVRPYFDTTLLFTLHLILILFVFFSLKKHFCFPLFWQNSIPNPEAHKNKSAGVPSDLPFVSNFFLIALLIFFPPLALAIFQALIRRPISGPSYDAFNMVGVYIALGFIGCRLYYKKFGRLAVFLILLLYLYQCLIFLPYRTRPEWEGAAEYLRKHVGNNDLVIDERNLLPLFTHLSPFLDDLNLQSTCATSFGDICTQAVHFFQNNVPTDDQQTAVWIVTEPGILQFKNYFKPDPLQLLMTALEEHGLQSESHIFYGGTDLSVIKARPHPEKQIQVPQPYSQILYNTDYRAFLRDLSIIPENDEEEKALIGSFQRSLDFWPPVYTHTNLVVGFALLRNKEYRLAGAFGKYLLSTYPNYGLSYYYMGVLLALAGESERAKPYFQHAFSSYPLIGVYSNSFSKELCDPQGILPGKVSTEKLLSFPYPIFADLEYYLNDTAINAGENTTNKIIPGKEKKQLLAGLYTGRQLTETIFSAQQTLRTTEAWLPITKTLPVLVSELCHFLTGDVESTANKYKDSIARFPFEVHFYDRYDFFLRQYSPATDYLSKWRELATFNPDSSAYVAEKFESEGIRQLQNQDLDAAIAAFEASLTLVPSSIDTAARLGDLYMQQDRIDEALEAYAVVLKQTIYFHNVLNDVDDLLEKINDNNDIMTYWRDIYLSNNNHWELVRRYGAALEKIEYFTEAVEVYLALKEDPDHGCSALMAGIRCLRLSGDIERALALLSVQNPEDCDPPKLVSYEYIATGQLLLNDHQISESSDCFNKALAIGGFDALAYFGLGQAALTLDDVKAAIAYFKESVNADPDNHWHRQCLAVEQFKAGFSEEALENFRLLLLNSPDKDSVKQVIISLIEKVPSKSSENMLKEFFETISPIVE